MRFKAAHSKKRKTPDKNEACLEEKLLNCNEVPVQADAIMGLGNNHVLEDTTLNMVEEFMPFENSTDKTLENHLPIVMSKHKAPILRLRSRATSRSERQAKGKSTSEINARPVRKTVSDSVDSKKRPTSQFYDLDFEQVSSNGASIFPLGHVASGSQPILSEVDELTDISATSSNLITRYNLSLHTSTPQLSPTDSLLQRFRKSFALRFQKKKTVSSTDLHTSSLKPSAEISEYNEQEKISNSHISIELHKTNLVSEQEAKGTATEKLSVPQTNCRLNDLHKNSQNEHEKRSSTNNRPKAHSNPPNIQVRKRNKRADWRMSLIYDSVDSVFDTSNKNSLNKTLGTSVFSGSDANIHQKTTASPDYSSKSKAVTDSLTPENNLSPRTKSSDGRHDLTRTASDTTSSEDQQKNISSLDQIWRANPMKLCRAHSRILMSKQRGRYRLRRSISQPVELEMTGSVHNLRECTRGSADHDSFQKGSLSSDDEASSESDIYHSHCCSPSRRSNTCWELSGEGSLYAEAIWDHETLDSEELPFLAGDIIEVTDRSDQDWWWGTKDGHGGWFPSAFVRLYVSHRTSSLHFNGEQSENSPIPCSPSKLNISNLSCEQVRANIVQEIVATEKDYVKHLKDVVEGYLKQVHRRPDMFSKERIETVFGNIREIYCFQSQFLKQLEQCLVEEAAHLSQIGTCFLNHKEEFKMYSQYCNNHPLAVSELQELYCDSQYIHFFEACRLLQEMIDISLDGFLLTPIQRICKYPLQLAELLKFTDESHPDHVPVKNALAAMREVAELVNERKRRMECLERIAEWQNTIEGWEGPDVLDTSSILIHCGEVTRVSSSWSRDIYLFIFDHQLIYCKKDLLKRQTYAYKGRLNLDYCDIIDVEDGKDTQFAVSVKNAWKIYSKDKDKWYLFYAKTSPEKDQWLHAFKTERQRVIEDEKQAFIVTEEAKKSARLAVLNKQKPKRPRAKFSKGRRCHPDVAVTEILLDSPSAKARSGSLPSNIHPELAIMAGAKLGPTRKKGSGWFHFGSGKKSKS
ncbi:LOW QUALITY PROTEIN: spermatogenesis-associated protein 13-like [Uloborus diversus]|uniref:LOW QUALITY PROTEIN: spermatogenesis-associated protein 13-like n=1 Tax=Uloborus diversus TaxID=327109 RepID=UPI00240930C9|nr:LOW QUALITY PROTEIN: spermatogenesis-associated protein 13-like [Uloborus diversus]